ncbi:MAG: monocarboxylate uptake permease MctP [Vitreoscilla sp.]
MGENINWTALWVFVFFFVLVTVMGFWASRWNRSATQGAHLDEWGLGGRSFGTWITWFLVGGDFYTAYTVIAVPALVYAVGAYGFFALPYTILVYPIVFVIMPRLWHAAQKAGHVTAADVVYGRYGSRPLELAVAVTAVVATMPYIALQLVGMGVVINALGFTGELPLAAAFVILALYTYSAGLRAPALIAFVKDLMIYIVVLVAVILVPMKLGGYAHVFDVASSAFSTKKAGGLLLKPAQYLPYATLALGSAMAAFMYPHTLTGIFAAKSADTIRKNAVFLPAYTVLLGLIALLGYMAYAAGVDVHGNNNAVVPALFSALFPSWFVGFAFAAIAIGALVPAAVMSIGAANLFTRNFWKAYVQPDIQPAGEAAVAKIVSLVVKVGALVIILVLPTKFALDLQLLGGVWILQTFPAVVFGLFFAWFRAPALLIGWAVGLATGTALVFMDGVKPVHTFDLGGDKITLYTGLFALAVNVVVAAIAQLALGQRGRAPLAPQR